jgi:hypothetical protein
MDPRAANSSATIMRIDHDQIIKKLIQVFFREFMELFFPREARLINFRRVDFLLQEHFTDIRLGNRRVLDLVVKVGLRAGGEKYVLIHIEIESSRKEADFPRFMFKRFCQLFLRHETEIFPIGLFTDDAVWRTRVPDFFELRFPNKTIVHFAYHLIKLKNLDHRQFLESKNPLAYALMAKMNYNRRERVRLKADFLRLILGSGIDPARQSVLVEFVETYMRLEPAEQVKYRQIVARDHKYQKVAKMITTYEQAGIRIGKKEGNKEGKQNALIMLLEKKFRKLKVAEKNRIRKIESVAKLDKLILSLLDAESLNEVEF